MLESTYVYPVALIGYIFSDCNHIECHVLIGSILPKMGEPQNVVQIQKCTCIRR